MTPRYAPGTPSGLLEALVDPTRVRMLRLIGEREEMGATDIQRHFKLAQPTISHHLRILARVGLIKPTKRSQFVYYRLTPGALNPLIDLLTGLRDLADGEPS